MGHLKPITIVGAGVAGLALGIGLRQRGIPVTVWESGRLPRHRVCGEVISGKGQATLQRLGLLPELMRVGATLAHTAAFFAENGRSQLIQLPVAAVCCSRFKLDHLLALEFQKLNGELRLQERWRHGWEQEGTVRASGRRIQTPHGDWRWIGIKAHARALRRAADVEVHLFPNGYIGTCGIEESLTNVCGLFRTAHPIPDLAENWTGYLRGTPQSELSRRMDHAKFDSQSFSSIAGLSFQPDAHRNRTECRIGDAFGTIAPFVGNGMSIAFESAELALDPLEAYSRQRIPWSDALSMVQSRLRQTLGVRLRLAFWIQEMLFHPLLRQLWIAWFARSPGSIQFFFRLTR